MSKRAWDRAQERIAKVERELQELARLAGEHEKARAEDLDAMRVTVRQQHVRCGKETCGACPHGPYWYAFWKQRGRTQSRYLGARLPPRLVQAAVSLERRRAFHW